MFWIRLCLDNCLVNYTVNFTMYCTRNIQNNPSIFSTLFLQVYAGIFDHIQRYSEYSGIFRILCNACTCRNLTYWESWNIQNPSIIISWRIFRNRQIYENLRIFRTLTYLKPDSCAELSQRFTMEFFAEIVKNYNYFSEAFHLRSLTRFCLSNLSISTH